MELVLKFDTRDHFCYKIEIDIRGVREKHTQPAEDRYYCQWSNIILLRSCRTVQ